MYSDQLRKNNKRPFRFWPAVASCLAFLLLLVAMFQVVYGQVEQAGIRQAQYNAAQTAIAGCAASYSGTVRRQCMEQVNASFMPYSTYTAPTETEAQANALAIPDGRGLQQATFAHR